MSGLPLNVFRALTNTRHTLQDIFPKGDNFLTTNLELASYQNVVSLFYTFEYSCHKRLDIFRFCGQNSDYDSPIQNETEKLSITFLAWCRSAMHENVV